MTALFMVLLYIALIFFWGLHAFTNWILNYIERHQREKRNSKLFEEAQRYRDGIH